MASILLRDRGTTTKMLRRFCALMLVALAASPFTAPFSTCSLGSVFGHASRAQMIAVGTTAVSAAADSDNRDAYSLSPLSLRVELPRRLPVAALITAPDLRDDVPSAGALRRAFWDHGRSPHGRSQRLTILRL